MGRVGIGPGGTSIRWANHLGMLGSIAPTASVTSDRGKRIVPDRSAQGVYQEHADRRKASAGKFWKRTLRIVTT